MVKLSHARACRYGYVDIVPLLLDEGADVNTKDNDGQTAIMWASASGYTDIMKMLSGKGADVNAKDDKVAQLS